MIQMETMVAADDSYDGGLVGTRPACDACKFRKTRCDRKSPCSTCATAKIPCLTTRTIPEKRQRVLLSSKYDDAMEGVNHQLQDIANSLKVLLQNDSVRAQENPTVPVQCLPNSFYAKVNNQDMVVQSIPEGYRGDSSFNAHVKIVADMLEGTECGSSPVPQSAIKSAVVQELLVGLRESNGLPDTTSSSHCFQAHTELQELRNLFLPPLEPILKLLRSSKVRKHRFFIDVPIIDEQEFFDNCQKIYFSVEPISIWTYSIVNVGLLYLLFDLNEDGRTEIGLSIDEVQTNVKQLSSNIEVIIMSLKLILESSMLACQALGLLAMYHIKSGKHSIAWRLITAASRMLLDIGFHRLPSNLKDDSLRKKRMLFWWMYAMDKGLAFTFGRTPIIHHYDVTTQRPTIPDDYVGMPRFYAGWDEYAFTAGNIHQQLFSATSQRLSKDIRIKRAKDFASRLTEIQEFVKASTGDTPLEAMHIHAALGLEIIMYSLQAVVYRIIPRENPPSHPLQCCDACLNASRRALELMVQFGQMMLQVKPEAWTIILNLIITMVPSVSFLALVGNAIALSSGSDMALLASTLAIIEPVADNSPAAKSLFDVCHKLFSIAEIILSGKLNTIPKTLFESQTGVVIRTEGSDIGYDFSAATDFSDYRYPMSQQDWDDAMKDFDVELSDIDARELAMSIEPYM